MQPIFGRFHSLRDTSGATLFLRLTSEPALQVLVGDAAYCASLRNPISHATVQGRETPPSLKLLALILAIPCTTAEILPIKHEAILTGENRQSKAAGLQLRCIDRSGVELNITITMRPTAARPILDSMHEDLFSAVAALEATVRDTAGEKHSHFLEVHDQERPSLSSVRAALHPLEVGGQSVETQAVFRRAAAADSKIRENRAFVIANAAGRVRAELLEQRWARKEAERKKREREQQLLRNAKRKHEMMMKTAHGKQGPVLKRKKKSLFEIQESDEAIIPEKSQSSAQKPNTTVISERSEKNEEPGSIEQKASQKDVSTTQHESRLQDMTQAVAKEEAELIEKIEPAPTAAKPPSRRKKKKKVRALV